MAETNRYRLKAEVHAEYVGALEAIMCSFRNGHYYQILGVGALVVEALSTAEATKKGGVSLASTTALLESRYPEVGGVMSDMLTGFFGDLEKRDLIEAFVSIDPPVDVLLSRVVDVPFKPAAISENTELADILTLDPIHDVGPGGWPDRQ